MFCWWSALSEPGGKASRAEAFTISERAHARTLLDAMGADGGVDIHKTPDIGEIRWQVLDGQSVLIEYFLGERRSWLWMITRDSFESFPLPGKVTLDPLIRRYYEAVTARNVRNPSETSEQRTKRLLAADLVERSAAIELGRILLGPVAGRIAGRRLLVVDDGLLRLALFVALGVESEVVLVPSASWKLNTGLVTLSACESGIGKDVGGQGMVGLSHAFLFAGAQRVVASLWKVEDSATASLMESFYRGIYQKKLTPAAALRAAQNEMRADARWKSPTIGRRS